MSQGLDGTRCGSGWRPPTGLVASPRECCRIARARCSPPAHNPAAYGGIRLPVAGPGPKPVGEDTGLAVIPPTRSSPESPSYGGSRAVAPASRTCWPTTAGSCPARWWTVKALRRCGSPVDLGSGMADHRSTRCSERRFRGTDPVALPLRTRRIVIPSHEDQSALEPATLSEPAELRPRETSADIGLAFEQQPTGWPSWTRTGATGPRSAVTALVADSGWTGRGPVPR